MSILFAATFPERVRSLVLYGTAPRFTQQLPDWPWGHSPAKHEAYADDIDAHWGEGALADLLFVSAMADMPGFRDLLGDVQRLCASPMMARMLWRALMDIDVRAVRLALREDYFDLRLLCSWVVHTRPEASQESW